MAVFCVGIVSGGGFVPVTWKSRSSAKRVRAQTVLGDDADFTGAGWIVPESEASVSPAG
jgi:hypothetical protein